MIKRGQSKSDSLSSASSSPTSFYILSSSQPPRSILFSYPNSSENIPFLSLFFPLIFFPSSSQDHHPRRMRESNFAFPAQNRAAVCISSQLYDRRGAPFALYFLSLIS